MIDAGEKRERILKTAVKLFGKDGFYGTRMAEVASQAKVSPKTLYKCFSGKKELFIASRDMAIDRLLSDLLSVSPEAKTEDSFATLERILKSYTDIIRRNRGLARILAESVAIMDEDIKNDQLEMYSNAAGAIAMLLEGDMKTGAVQLVADAEKTSWLFLSFASLLAYAVLLELDRKSGGGFDPGYALDVFFRVMRN